MQIFIDSNPKKLFLCIIFFFLSSDFFAQKAINIESSQGTLDFGTFWTQLGGDITIDENGLQPIISPNIIHLIQPNSTPVSFYITAAKNNNIYISETIINPAECTLVVDFNKTDPFLYNNNASTSIEIKMGGTLTVPPNPTPGPRSGSVTVKFSYINE